MPTPSAPTIRPPEDGSLDAASLIWSSDIDGQLATTGLAVIDTAGLTAGTHVLSATATDSDDTTGTATVTDSDDTTGTATVTVTIKQASEPPAAAAYGPASADIAVDVAANDSDAEGDIAPRSLSIAVPPAVGTASVLRPAAGVAAVAYRADIAGYDAFIYEVCDRSWQCAVGEAAVVIAGRS